MLLVLNIVRFFSLTSVMHDHGLFARILASHARADGRHRLAIHHVLHSAIQLLNVLCQHQINLLAIVQPLKVVLAPLVERLFHLLPGLEVLPALIVLWQRIL